MTSHTPGGLPLANKEINSNPGANSVTSPTDPKVKAVDVDRKMRFYGVIEAFRQGNYPDNKQIDNTLRYVLAESPIDQSKLSSEGRQLVARFQDIIETARLMVKEKNADELFQNFLWHTRHVDTSPLTTKDLKTPISKEEANQHGDQSLEYLRTLGKLIFTNSEMRKLLKDISFIGRDILADGAAKAADKARPADHELRQVDETAPANTWVAPDGREHGPNDNVPDTGIAEKREQAQQAKADAERQYEEAKDQAQRDAQDGVNRVQGAAQSQPGTNEPIPGTNATQPSDAQKDAAANEGKQALKEKTLGRIPQEHKDKVRNVYNENKDQAKDYLKDKFPEERRNRFEYRLKKVIVENQRHRDYQEAIDYFLTLAEQYKGHAKDVHAQTVDKAQATTNDGSFSTAQSQLRTLLERFANGQSMQPIFDAIDVLYTDAKNDPELTEWFKRADTYIRRVLQEPGYVMRDQCDAEGRALRDDGKGFFTEKYRPHRERLFNEIETFFRAYADDPLNVRFGEDWKALTKDLFLDGDGNLKYKPHLWDDIRGVILPQLLQHVGYIPIPRIEYTDHQVDLVIENLTLESQNILPNIIELEARNYFKLSPYTGIKNASKHSFFVGFSHIQADLRDVAFFVKKKSGFPKIKDEGVADVFIGGTGISGRIHIESSSSPARAFNVRDVKVKIDSMKFKIRNSKHNFLYNAVRPLATGLIKKQVAKAIQDAIRNGLEQLDAQLVDIKERTSDAAQQEGTGKISALQQVYNDKKAEAAAKKDEVTPPSDAKFQLTMKRDSKLVNWSSPNSIVEKQGEREDHAVKGREWRSPAFDIVSAPRAGATRSGADLPKTAAGSQANTSVTEAAKASAKENANSAAQQAGQTAQQKAPQLEQQAPISIPSAQETTGRTNNTTVGQLP